MKKHFWRVWLRPNLLIKDMLNDYFAVVSTTGHTKYNEDIAKAIKAEGSELHLETLLDVIGRVEQCKQRFLLNGFAVQDSLVHITPRVKGSWTGSIRLFDPAMHKVTIDAVPTIRLSRLLEREVGVTILGERAQGGALIGMVCDLISGKNDETLTPGGDLIITGEKIKIAPVDDPALGVRFTAADGTETPLDTPLVENKPKRVVCRVPLLAPGTYFLSLTTRYSSGGRLINEPRTLTHELPLVVTDNPMEEQ